MASEQQNLITQKHWEMVLDAIPEINHDGAQEDFQLLFRHSRLNAGDILPAKGLYVVIAGAVSLKLNNEELLKAGPLDYFYEEYLLLDELNVEVSATALANTEVAFLSKEKWDTLEAKKRERCLSVFFGDLINIHKHEFQQPINSCNITAAALSLTGLGFPTEVDDIFKSCALPVSYVVNEGMTIGELYDVASSHIFAEGLRDEVGVELYYFDRDVINNEDLFKAITESNQIGGRNDILVANFAVGLAHGNQKLKGGHFALIAKCNKKTKLVHMMDVHPEKYGKIWITQGSCKQPKKSQDK